MSSLGGAGGVPQESKPSPARGADRSVGNG